jgi:hypothetical protein
MKWALLVLVAGILSFAVSAFVTREGHHCTQGQYFRNGHPQPCQSVTYWWDD